MDMSCAVQTNDSPRFKQEDKEYIYALFDAFIKKTLVEDRAIDFSAPAILNDDGSIEFYESDYQFSDLFRGPVLNKTKACFEQLIAKRVTKEIKQLATSEPVVEKLLLLAAHFYWLWSLGISFCKTSCGEYSKALSFKEGWADYIDDYDIEEGLWNASTNSLTRKKELMLIYSIFEQFISWPKKPTFKNLFELKQSLVHFIFKTKLDSVAPIRNGLLHFCNPDRYIDFYHYESKVQYVENNSNLLRDYKVSDYAQMLTQDGLYFSTRIGKIEDRMVYKANRTEEKICYIYDKLTQVC
ncbi:hypothetical protein [Fibrobacter sp. UWB7]|uniref:hypothetical protein n=1 Tax=Fibrobacter sp. UWB7 TaxID=1896206 RepID=UPI0009196B16|nr:hypothetical protein [Fibrobacter sp. UWB7]SHM39649.1 hypothetical protein SAMN05720467_1183 [Fibrobacter sp. UWB7]